jgi:CheY-like chemotaxis protein
MADGNPGPKRILYIDDDETFGFLVKRVCEGRGHRVEACTSHKKALEILAADPDGFDLVITDYRMPGTDGIEVTRRVREAHPGLKCVLMSGLVNEQLSRDAAAAGIARVLHKPFRAEHLIVLIELAARDPEPPPVAVDAP